jgi:putative ATPase
MAINSAIDAVNKADILPVPSHILTHSKAYKYPHDFGGYVK